jgi:hypothetical protein
MVCRTQEKMCTDEGGDEGGWEVREGGEEGEREAEGRGGRGRGRGEAEEAEDKVGVKAGEVGGGG